MLKKYRQMKKLLHKLHITNAVDRLKMLSVRVTKYGQVKVKTSKQNSFDDKIIKVIDNEELTYAKLQELATFKRDLDVALLNYHNETFKAILRLYVFDNMSVKKIARRYNIQGYIVDTILDMAFKQVCRPKDNKQLKEQEEINKVTDRLSVYEYDCLINCRRDFILTIQDVAKIHNKDISDVAEDVARLEAELYEQVRITKDYDYMSSFEYNKQLLQSSRCRTFDDEEDLEAVLKRLYGID